MIVLKIYNRCDKTASKRAIQKTAEATGYLVGYKIADKISVSTDLHSKKSAMELHNNDEAKEDAEITNHKKKVHIYRRKTTNY